MKISQNGVNFIKSHEGCFLNAYDDGTGTMTIGYGHTIGVYKGMRITQEQAEEFLRQDLAEFENRVNTFVTVKLTQNQFDSLVSFDFNTGGLGASTLLEKLNAGDYIGAAAEFTKWVHINGNQYCQGLMNRRIDEKALFLDYSGQIAIDVNTNSTVFQEVKIIQNELNVQFNAGLTVDGKGGEKTIAAFRNIHKGAYGNITKWIQEILNKIINAGLTVDCDFGEKTEKAVKDYQELRGLIPDGIVGKNTFRQMLKDIQGFIY